MEGSLNGDPMVSVPRNVVGELKKDRDHAHLLHLNTVEMTAREHLWKQEYATRLSALWTVYFRSGGPMKSAANHVVVECSLEAEHVLHLSLAENHVRELPCMEEYVTIKHVLLMGDFQLGDPMEIVARVVEVELSLGAEPALRLSLVESHAREVLRNQEFVMIKDVL